MTMNTATMKWRSVMTSCKRVSRVADSTGAYYSTSKRLHVSKSPLERCDAYDTAYRDVFEPDARAGAVVTFAPSGDLLLVYHMPP